jgi:autoinducer 2-degrading protein
MLDVTKSSVPAEGQLALAVTWEAKEGEADAVADVLRRMADAVKAEPGTLLFWPHRSPENDRVFFLYELYVDDAAFVAHQQTEWFKRLVLGEALPRLARRERVQFKPFQ